MMRDFGTHGLNLYASQEKYSLHLVCKILPFFFFLRKKLCFIKIRGWVNLAEP